MAHLPASVIRGTTPVISDRRKYPHLHGLVAAIEKQTKCDAKLSALRWASRKLGPDALMELDGRIARKEEGERAPGSLEAFPHLMRLFSECDPQQKLVLVSAAIHLAGSLGELERNLERNATTFGQRGKM